MHLDISKCLQGLNNMYIDKENSRNYSLNIILQSMYSVTANEVARVAVVIAERLKDKGIQINVDELRGAALVHDVLRTEKDHDKLGAEVLMNMNLPHEAELVRRHMTYHHLIMRIGLRR